MLSYTNIRANFEQATIAERATAFKKQCELAETIKFKEIDLYVSTSVLLFPLFCSFGGFLNLILVCIWWLFCWTVASFSFNYVIFIHWPGLWHYCILGVWGGFFLFFIFLFLWEGLNMHYDILNLINKASFCFTVSMV